jgi:8-oxo-dGTP diphosphatase
VFCYAYPHPAVTTDIALFTLRENRLHVLLLRRALAPFSGVWALPGGFVRSDEDLDSCAKRKLAAKTGITGVYLEQLYTFGAPQRDPRERVISVAYYALTPCTALVPRPGQTESDLAWVALTELPVLAFDHGAIVQVAQQRLAAKIQYSTLAFQFLPAQFTLSELQQVYEAILGASLDKRNFRKTLLVLGQLEPIIGLRRTGHHRPAQLYRAKQRDAVAIIK